MGSGPKERIVLKYIIDFTVLLYTFLDTAALPLHLVKYALK